jgi:hypothetical protein
VLKTNARTEIIMTNPNSFFSCRDAQYANNGIRCIFGLETLKTNKPKVEPDVLGQTGSHSHAMTDTGNI